MAPHTQTAGGVGGITIKQQFQRRQWPYNALNTVAGTATNGVTTTHAVGSGGATTAPTGNGTSISLSSNSSNSGATSTGSSSHAGVASTVSNVDQQSITAFATTQTSQTFSPNTANNTAAAVALLRVASASTTASLAVSPSNKLKRLQPTTVTASTAAATAPQPPITTGVQTDGTGKSNTNNSNSNIAKRARPNQDGKIVCKSVGTNTNGPPALVAVSNSAAAQKKLTQMAIVAAAATTTTSLPSTSTSNSSSTTTTTANLLTAAAADLAKANKITGYFKSQLKPPNTFHSLKKSIKTVAGRASAMQQAKRKQLTDNSTDGCPELTTVAATTPTSTTIKLPVNGMKPSGGSTATNSPAPFSGIEVEKYLRMYQQQAALGKPANAISPATVALEAVAIATLAASEAASTAATTSSGSPSVASSTSTSSVATIVSKKVERKTARIAPTVSATRKISHTVQGGIGVGGKKPINIAPRTTTVSSTTAVYQHTIVAAPVSASSSSSSSANTASVHHHQATTTTTTTQKTEQHPLLMGKTNPSPSVLLTAIRLPGQQGTTTTTGSQSQQTLPPLPAVSSQSQSVQTVGGTGSSQYKTIVPQSQQPPPPSSVAIASTSKPMASSKHTTAINTSATSTTIAPAVFQFHHHHQLSGTAGPTQIPNLVQISSLLPLAAPQQPPKLTGGTSLTLAASAAAIQQQQQQQQQQQSSSAAAAAAFASALGSGTPTATAANLLVNANGLTSSAAAGLLRSGGVTTSSAATGPAAPTPQLVMNATFIKIHQIQQQQQAAAAQQAAQQQQQLMAAAASSVANAVTQQQQQQQQQQSFTMEASAMNMNFSGMFASKPTTTVVPYSCQPTAAGRATAYHQQNGTQALYSSALNPFATQQHPQQQLIMTPGGIFVNAAAIPAMFSSQVSGAFTQATANIPALHPLQPPLPPTSTSGNSANGGNVTTPGQLPNITAIIQQTGGTGAVNGSAPTAQQQPPQHHHLHHHHHPLLANITPAMLSNLQVAAAAALASSTGGAGANKLALGQATPVTGAQFVPISAAAHYGAGTTIYAAAPPTLGIATSMHHHVQQQQHQQQQQQQQQQAILSTGVHQSLSPPPLVATVPTYSTTGKPIMNAVLNGVSSTVSSSSGAQKPSIGGEPPGLVPVQLPKQQQPSAAPLPKLVRSGTLPARSNGSTQTTAIVVPPAAPTSPPALNPLTVDCGSSNDSGIVANSSDSEDKSLTIDLCSPGSPSDASDTAKKGEEGDEEEEEDHIHDHHHHHARTTSSRSSPLSTSSSEDSSEDPLIVETAPPAAATVTAVAVSPFPPPLRLLSDVAVAAAEAEAALQQTVSVSHQQQQQQNTATNSTVLEMIRQKHEQDQPMEQDEEEDTSSSSAKPDEQQQQSSQQEPMSVASSTSGMDLQEDYSAAPTPQSSSSSSSDGTLTQQLDLDQQKKPSSQLDARQSNSSPISSSEQSSHLSPPSIDTEMALTAPEATCAKSPILSQPKTIRFPAPSGTAPHHNFGRKGFRRSGDGRLYGVCYWRDCESKFDSNSQLLDHLQLAHVNTQKDGVAYACQWDGCKVHNKESTKFNWLEQHVLSHACSKLHKCLLAGCGMRFASKAMLSRHVNSHFANVDSNSSGKRSSDPPVPKVLRKTGKKLRYRRQPWSARRFDFFDSGVMEGLQHRLIRLGTIASGPGGAITFRGLQLGRRHIPNEGTEVLVRWLPADILPDEWLPELPKGEKFVKQVSIHSLTFEQQNELSDFLKQDRLNPTAATIVNPFAALHEHECEPAQVGGAAASSGSSSNLSSISSSNSSSCSWSNNSFSNSPATPAQQFNSRTAPKQQRKRTKPSGGTDSSARGASSSTGFSSIFSTSLTSLSGGTTTNGSSTAVSSCGSSSRDGSCGAMQLSSSCSSTISFTSLSASSSAMSSGLMKSSSSSS